MPRYWTVSKNESDRLNDLFSDIRTFDDAESSFGLPDRNYATDIEAGARFTVERGLKADAVVAYTRFSETADVRLLRVADGRYFKLIWPKTKDEAAHTC